MSDSDEKITENAPGTYWVAKVCIGCMICREIAPENFRENDPYDDYHAVICFVAKQPDNDAELSLCEEAMDICPANAIHNDGQSK